MKVYIIRPEGAVYGSFAWARNLNKAREIKTRLRTITGHRWKISKENI